MPGDVLAVTGGYLGARFCGQIVFQKTLKRCVYAVLFAGHKLIFSDFREPEKVDYDLTAHETRILKLLVDGYNFTTAAKKLGVSYNTVKFHMTRIYDKLQVHSKTDSVSKALQNRLFD